MNNEEYQGSSTVSAAENIRYSLLMTRKNIAISGAILFGVVLGIRTWQQVSSGAAVLSALLSALPMALLSAALVLTLQLCSTSLNIFMLYRQGRAKAFEQTVTLNREGVTATSSYGSTKVPWKYLVSVRETYFDFLLIYGNKKALILPKKQMTDPAADAALVRTILRAHLPAEKLRIKR